MASARRFKPRTHSPARKMHCQRRKRDSSDMLKTPSRSNRRPAPGADTPRHSNGGHSPEADHGQPEEHRVQQRRHADTPCAGNPVRGRSAGDQGQGEGARAQTSKAFAGRRIIQESRFAAESSSSSIGDFPELILRKGRHKHHPSSPTKDRNQWRHGIIWKAKHCGLERNISTIRLIGKTEHASHQKPSPDSTMSPFRYDTFT